MKRIFALSLVLGCGDEQPPIVDTSVPFEEADLDPSCEGIEGTWEATGLDVAAVEGAATRRLGGDALLLALDPDGGFRSAHLTPQGLDERTGSWAEAGRGRILVDPFFDGLTEPVTLTCRIDGERLTLYGTGPYAFGEEEEPESAQILVTLVRVPRGGPR